MISLNLCSRNVPDERPLDPSRDMRRTCTCRATVLDMNKVNTVLWVVPTAYGISYSFVMGYDGALTVTDGPDACN